MTNYFTKSIEDVRYLILAYLDYSDINKLSKTFKLYVDYEIIFMTRYPEDYTNIKKVESNFSINWSKLYDEFNKDDLLFTIFENDQINTCINIYNCSLAQEWKEIFPYLLDLPDDYSKYYYIVKAINQLIKYQKEVNKDSYLFKVLIYTVDQVDMSKLYVEFKENFVNNDDAEFIWICYLIMTMKYNTNDKYTGSGFIHNKCNMIFHSMEYLHTLNEEKLYTFKVITVLLVNVENLEFI